MAPPADRKGKAIAIDPNPEFFQCSICRREFYSGHDLYVHQITTHRAAVLKITPPPPNGPWMRNSRYPNAGYDARPEKEPIHPSTSSEEEEDDEEEEEGEEVNSGDIGRDKGQGQGSTGNRFVHAQFHQLYNRETSLIHLTKDLLREWSPMTASGENHETSFRRTQTHHVPMEPAPAHSGSSSTSSNEKLDLDLKL